MNSTNNTDIDKSNNNGHDDNNDNGDANMHNDTRMTVNNVISHSVDTNSMLIVRMPYF